MFFEIFYKVVELYQFGISNDLLVEKRSHELSHVLDAFFLDTGFDGQFFYEICIEILSIHVIAAADIFQEELYFFLHYIFVIAAIEIKSANCFCKFERGVAEGSDHRDDALSAFDTEYDEQDHKEHACVICPAERVVSENKAKCGNMLIAHIRFVVLIPDYFAVWQVGKAIFGIASGAVFEQIEVGKGERICVQEDIALADGDLYIDRFFVVDSAYHKNFFCQRDLIGINDPFFIMIVRTVQ